MIYSVRSLALNFKSNIKELLIGIGISFIVALPSFIASWFSVDTLPNHPDRSIWLDAAWRVSAGQIPHRDFITPIGSAWLYLNALPILIFGIKYQLFGFVSTIALYFSSLIVWIIIRPVSGILCTILILLYVQKLFISSFLDYNEIALFLFLILFATTISTDKVKEILFGVCAGIVLATLLFWKINFFVAGVALILISFIVNEKSYKWYLSFIITLTLFIMFYAWSIDWQVNEMMKQYRIPADIKGVDNLKLIFSLKAEAEITKNLIWYIVPAGIILYLGKEYRPIRRIELLNSNIFLIIIFLMLLLIQNAFCITNANVWAPHILIWIILMVGAWVNSSDLESKNITREIYVIAIFSMLTLWSTAIFPKFFAIYNHHKIQYSSSTPLGKSYEGSIVAGVQMLNEFGLQKKKIAVLGYANPFPALLQSEAPKHMPLWMSVFDSINTRNPPKAEVILNEIDVIMEPQWQINTMTEIQSQSLKTIYGKFIDSNFKQISKDDYWVLWVRNRN